MSDINIEYVIKYDGYNRWRHGSEDSEGDA